MESLTSHSVPASARFVDDDEVNHRGRGPAEVLRADLFDLDSDRWARFLLPPPTWLHLDYLGDDREGAVVPLRRSAASSPVGQAQAPSINVSASLRGFTLIQEIDVLEIRAPADAVGVLASILKARGRSDRLAAIDYARRAIYLARRRHTADQLVDRLQSLAFELDFYVPEARRRLRDRTLFGDGGLERRVRRAIAELQSTSGTWGLD